MTLIVDYPTLQRAVRETAARTSPEFIAAVPRFIQLTIFDLNRKLKANGDVSRVTATLDDDYIVEPPGFRWMVRFKIKTTPIHYLRFISSDLMDSKFKRSGSGRPKYWTRIGKLIEFDVAPDTAYPVEMAYHKAFPQLSGSAQTNWLTANAPDLLLFGALTHAEQYLIRDERFLTWKASYETGISELNKSQRNTGGMLACYPARSVV